MLPKWVTLKIVLPILSLMMMEFAFRLEYITETKPELGLGYIIKCLGQGKRTIKYVNPVYQ